MESTFYFNYEDTDAVNCKIHGKMPSMKFYMDYYPDIIVCARCYFDKTTEGLEKFTKI